MSTAYHFTILVWEDFAGTFTSKLVDYEHNVQLIYGGKTVFDTADNVPAGFGSTKDEAIYQLKDYLSWFYLKNPWENAPDFLDAKLINFSVEIRPEYRRGEKIFPVEPINLIVPCVYGHQEDGLLVCALPTIGTHFYYYDEKTLKDLVSHYVQEKLKGITPKELSRYLPPKNIFLEELVVQVNYKKKSSKPEVKLEKLEEIAQAVTEKGSRRRFRKAWERDTEVADLVRRITKEKANIIIVGEAGIGKTTVLLEAAAQVERQMQKQADKEDELQSFKHKFWITSGSRIIAGMQYLGQWEERCESVIEEISSIDGVLCIENLLDLVNIGGSSHVDGVAAFLLPYLQRSELKMIAEATPLELDRCRKLLPGFVDLFQILYLPQFSREQAISILEQVALAYKQNLSIDITRGVTEIIYSLFHRFMPYQSFPGKAVLFLQELFEQASQENIKVITSDQVIKLFISQTGLPELFLRDEIKLNLSEVVEVLNQQVIGQPQACKAVANLITTFKAGLNDPSRPIGVLLFCGPTGVGKTELAKSLAKFFFGSGKETDRLIRLDMSEYSGPDAVIRLMGTSFSQPSELVRRVRQQPFLVLLLDEIEKASKEIFDLFLGVFDEGRLTDQYGRTSIFCSAIIIMTSNIGVEKFNALGFSKQNTPAYNSAVMDFFRPEFYNRMDGIISFNSLSEEVVIAITEKELSELEKREGLKKANLKISWTKDVVKHLAKEGFEPRYGARPLQRTLEKLVVVPLAHYLVKNPNIKEKEIQLILIDNKTIGFMVN